MPHTPRHILPAPARLSESGSGGGPPSRAHALKAKRSPTQVACQGCRTRKAKCDGARPQCAMCARKGAACHYDAHPSETRMQALKRRHAELRLHSSVYEELYHQLLDLSEAEAIEILRRLRAGADVRAVVRQIGDGDLLLHVALTPEARSQRSLAQRTPAYLQPGGGESPTSQGQDAPSTGSSASEEGNGDDNWSSCIWKGSESEP